MNLRDVVFMSSFLKLKYIEFVQASDVNCDREVISSFIFLVMCLIPGG